MSTRKSRSGLSILAGGLSFVGAANAVDLITNGSFETSGSWLSYFNTYNYSNAYFTGPPVPASENPGTTWSWQHANTNTAWSNFVTPTNEVDHLQYNLQFATTQTARLTNALSGAAIDSGLGRYSFSAWLASYGQPGSNPEQPYVVLRFFDDAGAAQIGPNVIFDRTSELNAFSYANGFPNNPPLPGPLSDHDWLKYLAAGTVPTGARQATVYLTRSPNAGRSNTPDTYMDLVKLDVFNINDTTTFDSATPADGQANISPDVVLSVVLRDIATQVNTNSIQLSFEGATVTPTSIQKVGNLTTVQYDPPGLLSPLTAYNYRIIWSDNGGTVTTKTNQFAFTVAPYVNIITGPPIVQETFDGVTEGSLPAGWSAASLTDVDLPGLNLDDFHSDSYTNWVVISRNTLSNLFGVFPGGGDYVSTLNVSPLQFVNGAAVTNLISANFALAASASRFGNQVQHLFSGDYNLSGRTNVHLAFNSIYVQNQDSMGAVEYSIDGGVTWLPALYLLDGPDILRDALGNIDASNTLAAVYTDVPPPGNYGAFIGLAQNQWATAGPFLGSRANDDLTASKRREIVRLAQADNQLAVRFRFANVGSDSYYFGIDDLSLYSFPSANPPAIASAPASQTVAVGNGATLQVNAAGIPPLTYQWRRNGTDLPGRNGPALILPSAQPSDAGAYDVVVTGGGGSVTSAPPATLTVINPAVFVTGQWDFNGNLRATCGTDLQYYDLAVETNTAFGTTTSFGISDINGAPANVMKITPTSGNSGRIGTNPTTDAWGGFRMFHGAAANGGGTNVNQYTLVFDVLYPSSSDLSWRAILQAATTAVTGGDDTEFYINNANGIGISSIYHGNVTPDVWHRIVLAVDLSGPGIHPVVTKFIDGVKVGEQTGGLSGADARFSLQTSYSLLFSENNGFNNDAYISSVQFSNGRRPDAFLASLGGPSAGKIPGCINAAREASNIVIRWTGGVPLESADAVTGPWSVVSGATSPYTVPNPTGNKFFRPKIP